MMKQTTRAAAAGVLFSALLLYGYDFFFIDHSPQPTKKTGYIEVEENTYLSLQQEVSEWETKYNQVLKQLEEYEAQNEQKDEYQQADQQTNDPIEIEEKIPAPFKLEIKEGMTSKEISSLLAAEGIIDDAEKFNQYLSDHDQQKYIQIGTFTLDKGLSFQEIAKTITKIPNE